MFEGLAVFLSGFAISFLFLPYLMRRMRSAGIVGIDAHKREKPIIPEMGGIAIILSLLVSVSLAMYLFPGQSFFLFSFLATALIAGAIGAVDDVRTLSARVKPLLTILAGLPIVLMHTYSPYPVFPVIGSTRLTMVYPFLVLVAVAVCANAVNMMDPFNGTMSGTCLIVSLTLLASAFMLGRYDAVILILCLLGPLSAFFYFNKYPSKVFSGDVGSLCVGAALAAISILGQLEAVATVAFMPQIMNAFYGLSSVGRLYERREVSRPTSLLEDGRLAATQDHKAPITLARLILARGPLHEHEAVRIFHILSAISGILAIVTAYVVMVS